MYGEKGRIGLITLATDTGVLPETQSLLPAGMQAYQAPITLPRGEVTPRALAEMLETDELEQAAIKLAWSDVDVMLFACTTGSLVHGSGWDCKLIERIEAAVDVPATTTATAVLEHLDYLSVRKLAVITPYIDSLNEIEKRFLEDAGFEVTTIAGLGCQTDAQIGRLAPLDAEQLLAAIDLGRSEAIFISCTNWHVVEALPRMRETYGVPITTSNFSAVWKIVNMLESPTGIAQ